MKNAGIVTEYNPFHAGHAWQIAQLRNSGAKTVTVCMSGDVTQRGEMAIFPPMVRAQTAIQNGADLVLCLPNSYACFSAEGFASAGVGILSALPALDTLCFGAETPDADALMQVARALLSPEFAAGVHTAQKAQSFAALRAEVAATICPEADEILASPNNNLGVEYCKAILAQNSQLAPLPLPRKGADHGQMNLGEGGFASASFLRNAWQTEGIAGWQTLVPQNTLALYEAAGQTGQDADATAFGIALLSRLRGCTAKQLAQTRGTAEGLEHLLFNALRNATTLPELYAAMKSKRHTHARLRRYVLAAALGYTDALPSAVPYLHVLAANEAGLALLKDATLPADTSLARLARKSDAAQAAANAHAAAADLAALCRKTPGAMGQSYTQKPLLL